MAYNLASAAVAAGVDKSTVLRAIKAGRVSAERDATGQWLIQPAELHRIFSPLPSEASDTHAPAHQDALANELVAQLKAVIDDLRSAHQDALANALKSQGDPPALPGRQQ